MSTNPTPSQYLILLIDDDVEIREYVQALLGAPGRRFVHAAGGDEGVARFGEERFDLVIVDLEMPGASGFDVIESLRTRFENEPPIVVLSGSVTAEAARRAKALGADRVLNKPIHPALLSDQVGELLADRESGTRSTNRGAARTSDAISTIQPGGVSPSLLGN